MATVEQIIRRKKRPPIRVKFDPRRLDYATAWKPDNEARFFEDDRYLPFRFVKFADEIAPRSIQHTGWFIDDYGEKYRGAVFQLTARHGEQRFVVGYWESDSEGYVIDCHAVCNDGFAAAHQADRMAELAAEKERDFQETRRAGQLWANKREDCDALAADLREMLAERRDAIRNGERVSRTLERCIREKWAEMHEMRRECESLREDECPLRDPLRQAWLDGAGINA